MGILLETDSMESATETGTATVDDDDFTEAAEGLDTVDTNANVFTVAGCGLTCFKGTSAASLAFLVRICLRGPSTSSTGGRTSHGIGGRDNRRDGNILDLDIYYNKQCSLYM